MARNRLRTKLVLSLILTTAVLSGASLLTVQSYLRIRAKSEIQKELSNSFATFEQYVRQRQALRSQLAKMTVDAPLLKSLMTTDDRTTIEQDSQPFWALADSDLFVLANREGKIMAVHCRTSAFDREAARVLLRATLANEQALQTRDWWFENGHLYEVYVRPIYRGPENALLGVLVSGFEVNEEFAAIAARLTVADVAFRYGSLIVASSLSASQQAELSMSQNLVAGASMKPEDVRIEGENFVGASIALAPTTEQPVTLTLLKSYDAATSFLQEVNQRLLGIGLVALIAGSILMFLISYTLTRPLSRLASGVVALEKGDFSYPLHVQRKDEVGELTAAFDTMRRSLKESQQHLLHAERLATIGRMASTISHDLRHPLTTILAYAELLSDDNLNDKERAEMYRQIRSSVNNMAELIASLLEFSKAQEALQLAYGDCVDTLQDSIRSVKLRPEFRQIELTLAHEGPTQGWFDFAKLGRVFNNLLRNACEAVTPDSGRIRVVAHGSNNQVEITVSDNGSGIPEHIRSDVFQPFVTFGKADGTGLGLAVVHKIVLDHGGAVAVESTGSQGTTFRVTLPIAPAAHVTA